MKRILFNEKYKDLHDFAEHIDETFNHDGKVIHQGRNVVKVFHCNGIDINVKAYCVPKFYNCFAYRWLRKPKGERAYLFPFKIAEKGFESPESIAYVENRNFFGIGKSYYISLQCPYKRNLYELGNATPQQYEPVIQAFAAYVAALHDAGILHHDLSPGNILFDVIDGQYHFSLIDTNRMEFKTISLECGCANLARLWGPKSMFLYLAQEYAKARKADEATCTQLIMDARRTFWTKFSKKHKVKFQLEL